MSEKELLAFQEKDRKEKASLQLLLGDDAGSGEDSSDDDNILEKRGKKHVKKDDGRFVTAIDQDKDFAVDPTHKEYRKVVQGHNRIAKRSKKY